MLFLIKQFRIDYIRDHCKLVAFDIIKIRCLNKSNITKFYVIVYKMLEDLDNMYNEFDSYETFNARFYDPNFNIKKKETFNKFLITFIVIIASLQLFE